MIIFNKLTRLIPQWKKYLMRKSYARISFRSNRLINRVFHSEWIKNVCVHESHSSFLFCQSNSTNHTNRVHNNLTESIFKTLLKYRIKWRKCKWYSNVTKINFHSWGWSILVRIRSLWVCNSDAFIDLEIR